MTPTVNVVMGAVMAVNYKSWGVASRMVICISLTYKTLLRSLYQWQSTSHCNIHTKYVLFQIFMYIAHVIYFKKEHFCLQRNLLHD